MTSWSWDDDSWEDGASAQWNDTFYGLDEQSYNDAWAVHSEYKISPLSTNSQTTSKIPPSFDGRRLWFTYEEEIRQWKDITELDKEKWGPALRNRLEGAAAVYNSIFDIDLLKDPNNGLEYFIKTLRPNFVKGATHVFMWRYMQLTRFHRGQNDLSLIHI